ncbi:NitT/TauT family transport system ATP-binding protein [Azospirillum lipoferum]|uniref:ABC transporter ATP-binding protein n=1 Tax=Azospirillum lipoferum TaxID=193 RepID=A0A5A9GS76_AZOLI|nr:MULTISPECIES: ABC transporter ATP-binding protein [Azospirillum]KAA0596189.1 ABC transporter ATP-binding protein [Azospirillum lipoferum]MCP1611151.1 NitT/TauT family transport system ATP-binding protein [Azospirillum lipoferum]MDW5533724.1 ABC transporter ATP-binding protein [Azospirillum sp. NL1]
MSGTGVASSGGRPPLIALTGVGKIFDAGAGAAPALLPSSLSIADGEFVVFLGPSGCGKTTLLRMISGLLEPTCGTIAIAGSPLWDGGRCRKELRSRLGLVFQDAPLLPWLTVEENVRLPLDLRGRSPRAERQSGARAMLALVGAAGIGSRMPHEISGGMRQRVAIARALSYDPDVLLMDEPFAALDAISREALNLELQTLWLATRKTVVLVTHSMAEAAFLADRIVLFSPGPGRIDTVVEVPFPRPRSRGLTYSPEFQQMVRDLHERLAGLMEQP